MIALVGQAVLIMLTMVIIPLFAGVAWLVIAQLWKGRV